MQKLWLLCGASCSGGEELLPKETLVGNVSAVYRNKYVLETFCVRFLVKFMLSRSIQKKCYFGIYLTVI